ncbi:LolA family protein [Sphingobacterium sp. Mn56C]|uniref:LolA family protein n=1 Tax=Sphingobacterium sp. Mn56C TaxID=3395261 RepID=UPI003BCC09FC
MNKKIISFYVLLFVFLQVQAQEKVMSASEVSLFQKALNNAVKVKTLTADFTQYKKVGYVKNELVSTGTFYVKNPDKLAWYYESPVTYSMVFNAKKMSIQEKGKTKTMDVSRSKQFENISLAIQGNIAGAVSDNNSFKTTYFQTDRQYILKLDPQDKASKKTMKQLVLCLDKVNHQVAEIKIIDANDGYTRFVLSNQKVNVPIEDRIFVL